MQSTLITIITHRGLYPETRAALDALECPSVIQAAGLTNIAKARSIALDQSLAVLADEPSIDVVLLLDDDMLFRREDVQRLVDLARSTQHPQSAIYLKAEADRAVIAARLRETPIKLPRPRWYTGLGCLAVPRSALERVAPTLPIVGGIREWAQTGKHPDFPGEWVGEDFWFCALFGGVEMAPIAAGHSKPVELVPWAVPEGNQSARVALWPNAETVRQFLEGGLRQ